MRPVGWAQTVVTTEYATAVDGAITTGSWEFRDPSGHILVNSTSGITGGTQDFYGSSYADVSVASGLVGGTQNFHDNSQLRVQVTSGVGTASVTLSDSSSILLNADNGLSSSTNVTFGSAAAALNLNGHSTQVGVLASTSGQAFGAISNGGSATAATLTTTFNSQTATFGGVITDSNLSLVKSGTGTLILAGTANSYGGSTTISGGTLGVMSLGSVGSPSSSLGAPATVADGTIRMTSGTLRYLGAGETSNRVIDLAGTSGGVSLDASGTGAVILTSNFTATGVGNKTLTLTGTNTANNEIVGIIVDNGPGAITSVSKLNSGTWKLSGVNTFTGTLTLAGGTLVMANDAALGAGTFAFSNGTLTSDGPARTIANNVSFLSGTLAGPAAFTFTGLLTMGGNATLNLNNTGGVTFGAMNLNATAGNRQLFINGNSNMTVQGVIADGFAGSSGSLFKQGSGTLTLNGANTFSGGFTAQGGNIVLGNDAALGTGTLSLSGSTILGDGSPRTIANNISFLVGGIGGASPISFTGTLTATNFVILNLTNTGGTTFNAVNLVNTAAARTLTVNATTGNGVITGTIADSNGIVGAVGSLTKTGVGSLTLSGNNTFTGTLLLNGGNLTAAGGAGSLGAGGLTLQSGTLTLRSDSPLSYGLNTRYTGTSSIVIDRATSGTGVTQTMGTLSVEWPTVLTVSAGANVTPGSTAGVAFGATTISVQSPTIQVNTGALLALGALDGGGAARFFTKQGAGVLELGGGAGNWAAGSSFTVSEGTVRLTADNVLGVAAPANVTLTAQASTSGRIDLNGHNLAIGNLTLNGTTTGGSSIATGAGILALGGNVTYSSSNPGDALISGRLDLGAGDHQFTINNSSNSATELTVSATISGAGNLTKSSNGVLLLSGSNTYSGNTTLTGGSSIMGNDSAFGTGTLFLSGGNLQGDGVAHTVANPVVLSSLATLGGSSALTFSNTFTLAGTPQLTVSNTGGTTFASLDLAGRSLFIDGAGDITLNGPISNGGSALLNKQGAGILTLNGAGTYSGGISLTNSSVRVGNDLALGSGALTLNNSTLQVIGGNRTLNNSFGANTASTIDTNGFDLVLGGSFNTTDPFTKTGAGTLVLAGTVANMGAVNLQNGEIHFGVGDTSGSVPFNPTITTSSGTQIVFNRSNFATFAGVITGSGSVRKLGAGTLSLTSASVNTYSGGTTIAGGTILIANSSGSAFGTGPVTVNSGATLSGQGRFSGALQNDGTYAPTMSSGAIALSAFSQGATGLLQMDIGGTTRGTGYKALDITGAFTPGGTLAITFTNAFSPTTGASFDLFNFGSIGGTFSSLSLPTLGAGQTWDTSALYTTGTLSVSAIPEPSTYALGVGLVALTLGWIRRRRMS